MRLGGLGERLVSLPDQLRAAFWPTALGFDDAEQVQGIGMPGRRTEQLAVQRFGLFKPPAR